ncbi:stage II sporulation protein M, partial [Pseudomonas aeruginosa]|nr:stage II sporulation protein M [Pseudomonas aeruginosa]
MKQSLFEQRHQAAWQRFDKRLAFLEKGKKLEGSSDDFAADYRRLCQQLALAQERGYSSHLIDQLQQLAMRGHQQFYRHRSHLGSRILGFLLAGLPRLVREEWRSIAVASLLFYGSALLMGLLVYHFPDLIYSVVSPDKVSEMESMYAPETTRLGPLGARDTSDDWEMFGFYIMNNIGIAFQTFASGVLLGLGSLFFLLFNGLMIGSVAGHLTQIGYVQTFWPFVIGHGAFELTAITFAGAAGLKLGWAL